MIIFPTPKPSKRQAGQPATTHAPAPPTRPIFPALSAETPPSLVLPGLATASIKTVADLKTVAISKAEERPNDSQENRPPFDDYKVPTGVKVRVGLADPVRAPLTPAKEKVARSALRPALRPKDPNGATAF